MMEYEFDELIRPIPEGPDWWSSNKRCPKKIIDQSFGYELESEDMEDPSKISGVSPWPRTDARVQHTGYSWVELEGVFHLEFSIYEFTAAEIDVWIDKGFLILHGEHKEREEGDGTTTRSFTRRYMLPCDSDLNPIKFHVVKRNSIVYVTLPRMGPNYLSDVDVSNKSTK